MPQSEPILLRGPYNPRRNRLRSRVERHAHSENVLRHSRESFLVDRPNNLEFLLRQRYGWMNPYVKGKRRVVELGAGAGLSREFLENEHLLLTEYFPHDWIDLPVDALAIPFANESFDVVIGSHLVHHLASPLNFFEEVSRILKPGGYLLIQELHTSLFLRAAMRARKLEAWNYDVEVFDRSADCNNPQSPWSANIAIPEMLFRDPARFEGSVPWFRIERDEPCECLIWLLSGGVNKKVFMIPINRRLLKWVARIDDALVNRWPSIFAMGRRVVLRRL